MRLNTLTASVMEASEKTRGVSVAYLYFLLREHMFFNHVSVCRCMCFLFACLSVRTIALNMYFCLCLILSSCVCISSQILSFRRAPAMDARTAKRVAQVQHIKGKPYFKPVVEEPDPFSEASTRTWRYSMRCWVQTLKAQAEPRRGNVAHDVMAGPQ